MTAAERPRGWLDVAEKGWLLGVRVVVWIATAIGRRPAAALVGLIALYYAVFHPAARRASRAYLARVHGRARFRDVRRHLARFARCTLDRLFFVTGRSDLFAVTRHGHDHLRALHESGRGAVLLGAHLGSFEAMRSAAEDFRIPINVLGYFRNAPMINAVLERLAPGCNARVIAIDPASIGFVLDVRERVARGELVAILGDRLGPRDDGVEVEFLGGRARLPGGPYLLAALLGCPVYLTFALYREPNRYDLHCEPFAERIVLPRKARGPAIAEHAQRYARRLEHYCRMQPDNWFNFFDFWIEPTFAEKTGAPAPAIDGARGIP